MTDLRSPEEVVLQELIGKLRGHIRWHVEADVLACEMTDEELREIVSHAVIPIIRADREQVERDTIRRVVEWLRQPVLGGDSLEPVCDTYAQAADAIEAGEWKP